ncbi:hypothetical protein FRC11_007816 [Ceratobasidium sp. 423]|nr:hypothetical protein FRC11_007816 [Ceratobasidium sp. 423]
MATGYSVGIILRNFEHVRNGSGGSEFTIKKGQRLLLMESPHTEWWKFTLEANEEKNKRSSGLIPRGYTQEVRSVSAATACKGFVAQADGDLTITERESLLVYCVEGDWALVKSAQATGYVPTECVKLNKKIDQVIARLDFNATDPGELSFKKGETLAVLDRKYEHWWLCKNESDMLGMVPCNHVKVHSRFGSRSSSTEGATKPTISRQSTPISTPIGKKTAAREVVSQLVGRGCKDLTSELNLALFGEYPITHGGFSDIYRGFLLDGTRVAIKALRISADSINQDPKHLKRAARELHTWGKCSHPNVIPLLGLAIFRDRIGMVAPWMAHGSLPRYLTRVPGVDRFKMCIQICEGLAYLHQIGIIHCDLKGANVLVSDEGIPALTDFGNSLLIDRTLGFTQTTSGPSFTVRWSAAEIFEEDALHTEASDVYALGMTIYETMAGKIPYEGKNDTVVLRLVTVKKEFPERLQAMPNDGGNTDRLWKLLTMCWSFEPAARPSAAVVGESMRAIVSNAKTPILQPTSINDQNGPVRFISESGESQRREGNIQERKAEEEQPSEQLGTLEEKEAAKLRNAQAEELVQAVRQERFALPPIPDPEELTLALYSDPSPVDTTSSEGTIYQKAVAHLHANPLPRPPKESRRMSASSESSSCRTSTASADEPSATHTAGAARRAWANNLKAEWDSRGAHATHTADAARRAWANNLKAEWDRRGAHEEHHTHLHPNPYPPSSSRPYYCYRPASAEDIAHAEAMAAARRAEEIRRNQKHQEEIKYRERQAARAAREARETDPARKAFEEERKRLEEERRKKEEERRGNEEQVVIAAWQRYERGWQDLTNGVNAEGRPLTFYDIPWPVSMPARSFEELQSAAIEKFLLSPCHSTTKTRKVRLFNALKQWHIDAFTRSLGDRLEESHRTVIFTAVNSVMRTIIKLRNKDTDS